MWFKNLFVYQLKQWNETAESLEEKLAANALQPCGGGDLQTRGWVEPKAEGAGFVHHTEGQLLIALGLEKKLLPGTVVTQFAKARAAEIEEREGYKPGRKQMKEIKEQVTDELLPRAFAIRSRIHAWVNTADGWLVVDAGSPAKADELVGALIKHVPGVQPVPFKTQLSPMVAMTTWLAEQDCPPPFTIDQDCELKGRGDQAATVRYVKHALEAAEVSKHIEGGKDVTKLALTWADRVSFVLQENLQIKRLAALDVLKEQADSDPDADAFDTDFALMTGELRKLVPALIKALGGPLKNPV
ncbi:recombination-associated protein RdgC [Limnobacter sp.]|uniref:recombination-associated protein RdgC n=1 Tax=Limnobacter sp. TaxID=2003368 RepID=UPI0035187A82